MTLNFVMANPDFEAIEANGLSRFKYETIQASYRRQAEEDGLRARRAGADADASTGANADTGMGANADASAKTGTAKTAGESPAPQLGKTTLDALAEPAIARYFRPQLHGREHLNATLWLANARTDERQRRAFDLRMIGTDPGEYCAMDALNRTNTAVNRVDYLAEAAELFQQTFGYPSTSFIPSCYVWDDEVERVLSHLGITHIQSGRFRKTPRKDGSLGKKVQLMGGKTRGGQTLSIRNCNFEPARWAFEGATLDQCVARGLDEIEAAFAHNMPAVVCSHRVNYVGGVNPQNAQFGLEALGCMLGELAERHPDVEFLTSDQLGDLLREARR